MWRYHSVIREVVLLILLLLCMEMEQSGCSTSNLLRCAERERRALLDFKQGLEDPSNRLSSWVGQDCCTWYGISCHNTTGHVLKLVLQNPFPFDAWRAYKFDLLHYHDPVYSRACLVGKEVNPSLVELKHLKYLDLSWNNFSGINIPQFFGSFHYLTYLNLAYAFFGGIVPHHLGNLSLLQYLDLTSVYPVKLTLDYPHDFELHVDNWHWMSRLSSLQNLLLSGVTTSDDVWPQAINLLPSLLELHLSGCGLRALPLTLSSFSNLTSLSILDLSSNSFEGPIPNAFGNYTSLKILDLSNNSFQGPIPNAFGNYMTSLKVLDLSYNLFNSNAPLILDVLRNLCNLETLDLSNNQLSGKLPNWLGQFKNLKYLSLSNNSFYGPIPTSLGRLTVLRGLYLSFNKLNGTIPKSLGQLSELQELDLYHNSLKGVISEAHFTKLSKLQLLYLGSNSLVWQIRFDWAPPFQMKYLDISSCQISEGQFPKWLQTQASIVDLHISNASISDSLPNWSGNFSTQLVFVNLSHNQIHGKLPNFLSSSNVNILYFDLSSNKFEGPLPHFPPTVRFLDLSSNSISGPIPQNIGDMCPRLIILKLSNNTINGSIPISLCKMKTLHVLDVSKNHLFGDLLQCQNDDLQQLEIMDFASNNLSGVIPSSIGHLQRLKSLHLNINNFSGNLPLNLKNCKKLVVIDLGENKLSGNIPLWIGSDMPWLQILRLRSNLFDGNIPSQLCYLTRLQVMDLANNTLYGTIPHCFQNLSAMTSGQTRELQHYNSYEDQLEEVLKGRKLVYKEILSFVMNMDLSSNNLSGEIPEEMTTLIALQGLNLSRNHLTGSISRKIGQMKALESLDLSRNQLSGKIPQSISDLTFLSYINLSYNNLSGKIPSGYQLQTLNDSFICDGNLELCGYPLEKKCPGDEVFQASTHKVGVGKGEGKYFKIDWFYIGMVSVSVVGFLGVCGALLFKKTWRYAYFQFVDEKIDLLFVVIVVKVARLKKKLKCNQVEN